MNKNYIIIFSIVGALVLGALVLFAVQLKNLPASNPYATPQPGTNTAPTPQPAYVPKDGAVQPILPLNQQADFVIDITTTGFNPDHLTVKKGDSVIWTDRDRYSYHQLVSTGSAKSPGLDSPVLKLGESWRVTFNTVGTFTYADKLNPKFTGSIVVQ